MVSIDKIQRGAARYLDAEIMPKAEGKDKWIISAAGTLYLARLPALIQALKSKEAIALLGIISEDGMSVDLDAIMSSIKPAARQAPATIKIPFGGAISFTEGDIDILKNYIMQA